MEAVSESKCGIIWDRDDHNNDIINSMRKIYL